MGSGGFRPASAGEESACPRGRTASPRSPRGGRDAGMTGACGRTGAGAAGALPVPAAPRAAPSARSGGSAGRRAGSARSGEGRTRLGGQPSPGRSPSRGPLWAPRTPRHVWPWGTSCPGLGLRGLSRALCSPPRVLRASPAPGLSSRRGKPFGDQVLSEEPAPALGRLSLRPTPRSCESVSCGFASGMYLPWLGSCKQEPQGGAGKRSLLALPAVGWN